MSETADTGTSPEIFAAEIVAAYVRNNPVPAAELPGLIDTVRRAFEQLGQAGQAAPEPEPLVPAVPVKKSVTNDYIICLEDGKSFKSLKRHLLTHYNLSPEEYRQRWNLPANYPMVAPSYAKARSELALSMGLGRKRRDDAAEVAGTAAPEAAAAPAQEPATAAAAAEPEAPKPAKGARRAKGAKASEAAAAETPAADAPEAEPKKPRASRKKASAE